MKKILDAQSKTYEERVLMGKKAAETRKNNQTLITIAPELLIALRIAYDMLRMDNRDPNEEAMKTIANTIVKAEGEQK